MQEPTVRCGCGRTMTHTPRHGRGAFRCGCGALVRIEVPARPASGCVGVTTSGDPCSVHIKVTEPFPLCKAHYKSSGLMQYHEWRRSGPEEIALDVIDLHRIAFQQAVADAGRDEDAVGNGLEQAERERYDYVMAGADKLRKAKLQRLEDTGTIYFMQIGDLVKIGKTLNLWSRMTDYSYPGRRLLGTETGYTLREQALNRRFGCLRHSGEWFRAEQPLLDYVASLPRRR